MKKLSFLLVAGIVFLAGTFTSCEKVAEELENAVEVTVNTTLEAPMVAVPEANKSTDADATFKEEKIVDLATNEDLKDNLDKIQSIEATSLTVTISSSTPDKLMLKSGTFSVTDNVLGTAYSFAAANFLLTNGASLTFGPSSPGWAELNMIIASKNPFTVKAIGTINSEEFTVEFVTSIGVKAKVKM
jgi:hypothetical protein